MSQFLIHKVYYCPGADIVTVAVEALDGPFRGQLHDLYTSQTELAARKVVPDGEWGDAEVRSLADEKLTAMNAQLVLERPKPPAPPADEEIIPVVP